MKTITFSEFRTQASGLLNQVEQGETFIIIRHGRPIAEVIPYIDRADREPAWKQPGLKLQRSGAELSAAILAERETTR